jgi:hypothetical protein
MNTHFLYCWLTNTVLSSSPYNFNERSLIQHLDSGNPSTSKNRQLAGVHLPAAIVSPPLRIRMRPISLFIEKDSKGMTVFRAPEPPNVACRIAIWTSAEVPFVRTLIRRHCVTITTRAEEKVDKPRVALGDGTRSTVQRSVQFRYRRWDIARMMKELDLNKKMHETWFARGRSKILAYRTSGQDWHLDVENDDPCRKGRSKFDRGAR